MLLNTDNLLIFQYKFLTCKILCLLLMKTTEFVPYLFHPCKANFDFLFSFFAQIDD